MTLTLDERYVRSIQIGQRIVVIHGQHRQSLYALILSRIHQHPSIEIHLALIQRWQEDAYAAYQIWKTHGGKGLEELLVELQRRGSKIVSTLTLRQWLNGETLAPLAEPDLRRLGDALDIEFVQSYHRKICQAATRLRGLHRSTARRLNRWLEQQSSGVLSDSSEDLIDSDLGLKFSDIQSSLLILRVKSVQVRPTPLLRSELGNLERINTDA